MTNNNDNKHKPIINQKINQIIKEYDSGFLSRTVNMTDIAKNGREILYMYKSRIPYIVKNWQHGKLHGRQYETKFKTFNVENYDKGVLHGRQFEYHPRRIIIKECDTGVCKTVKDGRFGVLDTTRRAWHEMCMFSFYNMFN
jgi:antitoxin component YwqK of YwqJK toxin-antitoxin module